MEIRKDKYIEFVVNNIEKGSYPGYSSTFNGHFIWSVKKGRHNYYQKPEPDAPGFTITLSDGHAQTRVYLLDKQEVIDTIVSQDNRKFDIADYGQKLADYLTSKEGRWGIGS